MSVLYGIGKTFFFSDNIPGGTQHPRQPKQLNCFRAGRVAEIMQAVGQSGRQAGRQAGSAQALKDEHCARERDAGRGKPHTTGRAGDIEIGRQPRQTDRQTGVKTMDPHKKKKALLV